MKTGQLRFGLVGYGAWGQCHAGAIQATDGAELGGVAVPSRESRDRAVTDHPQAFVTSDYRELVERDDIDVIDIVLPSHLHFEVAEAALQTGKHVLLEKPMALQVSECQRLNTMASDRNLQLAVGHELRLSSLWAGVHSLIQEGVIGDPLYCLVELSRRPYRQGASGWRYDIGRVGSWILEEPIHFFDLARWYLESVGEPQSVYATASSAQQGHPELHDNFSAIMHFPEGAYAVVTQTLAAFEHHQTAKVTGTKGAIWASWSGAQDRTRHPDFSLRVFDGETVETRTFDRVTGEIFELEDQMARMVASIRGDEALHATGQDGMWSTALCIAAARSIEESRRVGIDEILKT